MNALFTPKLIPYWRAFVWVLQLGVAITAWLATADMVSAKAALVAAGVGPLVGAYIHEQLPRTEKREDGEEKETDSDA